MSKPLAGFFKRKKADLTSANPQKSAPLEQDAVMQTAGGYSGVYPSQVIVGCGQSVGMQRDHNEDALYYTTRVLADGQGNESFGLFILADGMGGHRNGEIASAVTCQAISNYILEEFAQKISDDAHRYSPVEISDIISKAVNEAQKAVLKNAPGGGTTVIIALLTGDRVTVSNVGDSRVYFIHQDGKMQRITRDHSLVQRLLDLKEITEAEAEVHPQKNVLLRAVGQPDPFQVDTQTLQFPEGARMLLCSDGLWGVVEERTIVELVNNAQDPIIACKNLVDAANRNGGPDNISVILVARV